MKTCLPSLVLIATISSLGAATVEDRLGQLEARVSEMQLLLEQLSRQSTSPVQPSTRTPGRTYQVRTGDSYWSIARRHGLKVSDLEQANPGINPRRLAIGHTLNLPGKNSSPSPAATVSRTHQIRKGEVMGRIAQQYSISLKRLMEANPEVDPRRLRIGGILTIPGQAVADTTAPAPLPSAETKSGLPEDPVSGRNSLDEPSAAPNPYLKALESTSTLADQAGAELDLSEPKLITLDEDTRFSEIASEHQTTVSLLNELNRRDLSPNQMIKAGSQLYIPTR